MQPNELKGCPFQCMGQEPVRLQGDYRFALRRQIRCRNRTFGGLILTVALRVEGIISARISGAKTRFGGDEHGKLRKAVGTRGIGIWVVPAVTGCSYGSGADEIPCWTGDHRSCVKSRLDPAAATLPRGAGFSWPYHYDPLRFSHVHVGGFPWPDLAGTSPEVLTAWRERREPQVEAGKAGENGG